MSRVYIGGLNHRTRERDVEKLVHRYGRVREISLKNGFCFIEFDDYRDADDAVYELNGTDFMGERINVEIAKGTPHGRDRDRWGTGSSSSSRRSPSRSRGRDDRSSRNKPVWMDKYGPPTRTDYRVIVENLSSRVSWQDLKDYMRQAGDVTYADAHRTKRNEGTVEFTSYKDMKAAIDKLDDTELNGRRIKLIEDKPKGRRSRSRSRSHSRSRSRTRSRSPRKSKSRSRSRSRSKSAGRDKNGSKSTKRSRSRSDSRSPRRRSHSGSRSPRKEENGKGRSDIDD